jgi:hypothetical protein
MIHSSFSPEIAEIVQRIASRVDPDKSTKRISNCEKLHERSQPSDGRHVIPCIMLIYTGR